MEETKRYSQLVDQLKKDTRGDLLENKEIVIGLLNLVKGIDQLLLTKTTNNSQDGAPDIPTPTPAPSSSSGPSKKVVEFDVGIHLPKNFKTPAITLNKHNCPGLISNK